MVSSPSCSPDSSLSLEKNSTLGTKSYFVGYGGDGVDRGVHDVRTQVYLWPIHIDVWQKPSQYCKVFILQLK